MRHQQDSRSRRKPRHRKSKTTGPASEPRYFSTHATVVTTPKNECTIFRGNELRREVTLEAVLHGQDSSSRYPLRFTNKSILELASKLKPGDQIKILKGRFDYRHKRAETELRVADFVIRT
jgi:hypothetical protein